ncbi:MAG: flavodoxin [Coriobacteriia bacterium]|nr:flavodoxin [Coriobacteriia bacterium]
MKAIVVYESLWGNTAAVARAIAEGLGPDAVALSTADASGAVVADADLIVAGAPVHAFRLPTEESRGSIGAREKAGAPSPRDLSHPSLRSWLEGVPHGGGRSAAFETRFRFSPGGATSAIARALEGRGYPLMATRARFFIAGSYGPLREGEIERARAWGEELARKMG